VRITFSFAFCSQTHLSYFSLKVFEGIILVHCTFFLLALAHQGTTTDPYVSIKYIWEYKIRLPWSSKLHDSLFVRWKIKELFENLLLVYMKPLDLSGIFPCSICFTSGHKTLLSQQFWTQTSKRSCAIKSPKGTSLFSLNSAAWSEFFDWILIRCNQSLKLESSAKWHNM